MGMADQTTETYSYATHGATSRMPDETARSHRARLSAGRRRGGYGAPRPRSGQTQEDFEKEQQKAKEISEFKRGVATKSAAYHLSRTYTKPVSKVESIIHKYKSDTGEYVSSTRQQFASYGKYRAQSERETYEDLSRKGSKIDDPIPTSYIYYKAKEQGLIASTLSKLPQDKGYKKGEEGKYAFSLREQEHAEKKFGTFIDSGKVKGTYRDILPASSAVGRWGAKVVYGTGSAVVGFGHRLFIDPGRQWRERPVESVSASITVGTFVGGQVYNWARMPSRSFVMGTVTEKTARGTIYTSTHGKDFVNVLAKHSGFKQPFKPTATAFKTTVTGQVGKFTTTRTATFPKGHAPTQHQALAFESGKIPGDKGTFTYHIGASKDMTIKGTKYGFFETGAFETQKGALVSGASYYPGKGALPYQAHSYTGIFTKSVPSGSGGFSAGTRLTTEMGKTIIDVTPQTGYYASGFLPVPIVKSQSPTTTFSVEQYSEMGFKTGYSDFPGQKDIGMGASKYVTPPSSSFLKGQKQITTPTSKFGGAYSPISGTMGQGQIAQYDYQFGSIELPKEDIEIFQTTRATSSLYGGSYVPTPSTPFDYHYKTPPPPIFFPSGGGFSMGGIKKKKGKQKRAYTPTVYSVVTKLKASKIDIGGVRSGLGARPIIKI